MRNTTFVNFASPGSHAVTGLAKEKFTKHGGGWETRFERITWVNSPRKAFWRHAHEGVFYDMDGSFAGEGAGASIVASTTMLADNRVFPDCLGTADKATVVDFSGGLPTAIEGMPTGRPGLVCRRTRFARVALNEMLPDTSLKYVDLLIKQAFLRPCCPCCPCCAFLVSGCLIFLHVFVFFP